MTGRQVLVAGLASQALFIGPALLLLASAWGQPLEPQLHHVGNDEVRFWRAFISNTVTAYCYQAGAPFAIWIIVHLGGGFIGRHIPLGDVVPAAPSLAAVGFIWTCGFQHQAHAVSMFFEIDAQVAWAMDVMAGVSAMAIILALVYRREYADLWHLIRRAVVRRHVVVSTNEKE